MTITYMIRDNKNIDMSETVFWSIVDAINWETVSSTSRGYDKVSQRLCEELTIKEVDDLRAIARKAVGLLDTMIGDRNPARGGDDSHSDLCNHIIGLGRDTFYSSLDNYDLIEDRGRREDYVESFSYCLPYPRDMPQMAVNRVVARKFTLKDNRIKELEAENEGLRIELGEWKMCQTPFPSPKFISKLLTTKKTKDEMR